MAGTHKGDGESNDMLGWREKMATKGIKVVSRASLIFAGIVVDTLLVEGKNLAI